MPKTLYKVQKHVRKKKGQTSALHENSRDAQRIRRAQSRDERVGRHEAARQAENLPYIERVQFFKTATQDRTDPLSPADSSSLVTAYLTRHTPLLASLAAQRRPGRPSLPKLEALKQLQVAEQREYASGFWMPDLEDKENLKALRAWQGEWSALSTMGFVRVTDKGVRRSSRFPPNGQS